MFEVWMRLLAKVPGSVLWLKQPPADARANLEREAAGRGIDPARLVYADTVALDVHLARHALADLFLDTLPYNAHATGRRCARRRAAGADLQGRGLCRPCRRQPAASGGPARTCDAKPGSL